MQEVIICMPGPPKAYLYVTRVVSALLSSAFRCRFSYCPRTSRRVIKLHETNCSQKYKKRTNNNNKQLNACMAQQIVTAERPLGTAECRTKKKQTVTIWLCQMQWWRISHRSKWTKRINSFVNWLCLCVSSLLHKSRRPEGHSGHLAGARLSSVGAILDNRNAQAESLLFVNRL